MLIVALVLPVSADEGTEFDLLGTWYVLVHYTDADAAAPGQPHWNDKVWVFERTGTRLKWTEYPVVAFSDASGRFERMKSGRMVRTQGAWEPSPGQLAQVASGLEVNARNAQSKTLRGDARRGYRSGGGIRVDSTSVIGFSESWEVSGLDALPDFRRDAVMDSGRSEGLEGSTRYRSRRRLPEGGGLEGEYERDESLRGSFRMLRAGEVVVVGAGGRSKRGR